MVIDKKLPHAIFLDIDGTLMENGKNTNILGGEIPEINVNAIKRARELGHKVFINTGRGYSCLPTVVKESGLFDGYITALGSYIEMGKKILYNNNIPNDMAGELVEFMTKNNITCRFQGYSTRLYTPGDLDYGSDWTKVYHKEDFYELLGDDVVQKITVVTPIVGEINDFLRERLMVCYYTTAGEAAMKGCNKANAMKMVLDAVGIPVERSIAMGDGPNDVEVLTLAGTSVATDNASQEVKDMCDIVTADATEGGVGLAIEKLLL